MKMMFFKYDYIEKSYTSFVLNSRRLAKIRNAFYLFHNIILYFKINELISSLFAKH